MCTVVVLRRPDHPWPLLLGANRDEMADRPWLPPGTHWPDRRTVVAGLDILAGGTWLGVNEHGVVAAVLNRINSLGPAPGLRSRGELPLEALDHAEAVAAAEALAHLDPEAYRPFNMVVADARDAFWLRGCPADDAARGGRIDVSPIPAGLSMITAYDLNDTASPRMRRFLPLFRDASEPRPEADDWGDWRRLLADRGHHADSGPGGAMEVVTDTGFGTVSSSLLAVPARDRWGVSARWLFAPGRPGEAEFAPIAL